MKLEDILKSYNAELKYPEIKPNEMELLQYLQEKLMDRSIPEENKVDIRKQYEELVRLIAINMPMPHIVLTPKEEQK
ncbi:hypothetical protein [Cohnella zeiphila]|uniref:Uncharacterized protein n=1 Tax=Cohnella zeiphila TaxID=2761120 RepID=A0A7X0SL23_9BACL|nr:hypothetical protein [Cohnella zeiphila]MBB6731876.1 hypothetical protein [Cohnella zeiphila]